MKYLYLYIIVGILGFSCQNKSKKNRIYFGGEVVNPKSDVVLLMQNNKVIDSIYLDKKNTFGSYYSHLKKGLYYFKHGYEYQYLYLEPQDSISIRFNTWDFDESLVFDGKGANKNELLLNIFLVNENEEKNFNTYFSLSEIDFIAKIKQATVRQKKLFNRLQKTDKKLSEEYKHIINSVITYPYYNLMELYPYYHQKQSEKDSPFVLSKKYYNFRNLTNLNDELLTDYYEYQKYVTTYLYNTTYLQNNQSFDGDFKILLLNNIVEKVQLPHVKNRMLYKEIEDLFFDDKNELKPEYLDIFYAHTTDTTHTNIIKKLISEKEILPVNSLFPDFKIALSKEMEYNIKDIIKDKSAAIYFCSSQVLNNDYLKKRVQFLTNKYPNVTFIGINTSLDDALLLNNIPHQYYLPKNSKGAAIVSNEYPRVVLVNSKGDVSNSYTLLTNSQIERQLNNLLLEKY